jgi:hypothetical protein
MGELTNYEFTVKFLAATMYFWMLVSISLGIWCNGLVLCRIARALENLRKDKA